MILTAAGFALFLLIPSGDSSQAGDSVAAARRLVATAQLAAQEYRIGVDGGQVVAPAEVEEARLFLSEARRAAVALPSAQRATAEIELDRLIALVAATGAPDSLDAAVSLRVWASRWRRLTPLPRRSPEGSRSTPKAARPATEVSAAETGRARRGSSRRRRIWPMLLL